MTPTLPAWYTALHQPILQRFAAIPVDPFTQPADPSGYIALHQNDYLRLAAHPEVIAARCAAIQATGAGVMASSIYGGDRDHHRAFQDRLARVTRVEASLLTTSGWSANVGLIEAICPRKRPIYLDRFAHASLWLGARLGRGAPLPIPHNRPDLLEPHLGRHGPGVIVIDAVYSTTGAVAEIGAYAELAERHDSILVVDESHAFGIFGDRGGGLCVDQGCDERVHFRTVSLAKALAGAGGVILGDAASIYWLRHRATSAVFSSAPAPADSIGHDAALAIIEREPDRALRCRENADRLRAALVAADVDIGPSAAPIVSLYFDREIAASLLFDWLKQRRVLASVFLTPATPPGRSLLRFSLHSELSAAEIDEAAAVILAGLRELGLWSAHPP